ncbi:hypothetical protein FQZ97_1216340 [compost metagenome]
MLQLGLPRPIGLHRLAQSAQRRGTGRPVQGQETRLLAVEVLVETAFGHAGLAHDVGDGRGRQAFVCRHGRHGAHHALAVLVLFGLGGADFLNIHERAS